MNRSDLPLSHSIDAQAEMEALQCWRRFFDQSPYSVENMGVYDLVRGVLVLPFLIFFITYILPIGAVIYILWFLNEYLIKKDYIIPAVGNFFKDVVLGYIWRYIACNIPIVGPSCPNLMSLFVAWRTRYIDIPVEEEKMRYFRFYYLNRKRFYELPKVKYIDQTLDNVGVKADYSSKFMVRAKNIFFDQVLTGEQKLAEQKWNNPIAAVQGKGIDIGANVDRIKWSWQKAGEQMEQLYSGRSLLLSFLLLLFSLGILYYVTYYNISGKPNCFYQFIGPLYRWMNLGSRLSFLSGSYNWLAIVSVAAASVGAALLSLYLMHAPYRRL